MSRRADRRIEIVSTASAARNPELLQGILRGERALSEGRVLSQAQAEKRHERWQEDRHFGQKAKRVLRGAVAEPVEHSRYFSKRGERRRRRK